MSESYADSHNLPALMQLLGMFYLCRHRLGCHHLTRHRLVVFVISPGTYTFLFSATGPPLNGE